MERRYYLARYNINDGKLEWAKEIPIDFLPVEMSINADIDRIYFVGRFPSFGTAAFDMAGELLWQNHDSNCVMNCKKGFTLMPGEGDVGIYALDDRSFFVAGNFWDEERIGDRFGNETILHAPCVGSADSSTTYMASYFVARYSGDGELLFAANTYAGEVENYADSRGATLLGDNLLLGGQVDGTVVFGEGQPSEVAIEGPASFIALYRPDGTLE